MFSKVIDECYFILAVSKGIYHRSLSVKTDFFELLRFGRTCSFADNDNTEITIIIG